MDGFSAIYALCRKSSPELTSLAESATSGGKVKVVENISVTDSDVSQVLKKTFGTESDTSIPIHLLVHNAGAYGPPKYDSVEDVYGSQSFDNIDAEAMRFAFELNTVAPLLITRALAPNLVAGASSEGENPGKVIIISSAMGSIADNGSGGHYGYRAAKAGINMVGKSLSVDLKDKNIAVGMGT